MTAEIQPKKQKKKKGGGGKILGVGFLIVLGCILQVESLTVKIQTSNLLGVTKYLISFLKSIQKVDPRGKTKCGSIPFNLFLQFASLVIFIWDFGKIILEIRRLYSFEKTCFQQICCITHFTQMSEKKSTINCGYSVG